MFFFLASSLLLVSSVSSEIMLLVLLVFLAACLACRSQLCIKQPIAPNQNQRLSSSSTHKKMRMIGTTSDGDLDYEEALV
ncbi:hypothetical protein ILYODFUR_024926 [Ilyodon furcidens]|uniref:Secreted protein n=1 Tax=Ilyodon furcidens TaxID=33524 RepID=A0ABV0UX68_9TELE